jgi:hypothetical protein
MRANGLWTCWGNNEYGQLGYLVKLPLVIRNR